MRFDDLSRASDAKDSSTVVALHCSGAGGVQWRQLGRDLGRRFSLVAPDLIGTGSTGPWSGERSLTLSDEAASIVDLMDAVRRPVHLVGHSYGASVALRCAVERPTQVASLTLYEPAAFYVLKTLGPDGRTALDGLREVARGVGHLVSNGANVAAAKHFVEFWNGAGSWMAIRPETRDSLARYIPKASLEFSALFAERTPLVAYGRLNCPILLLQGEHSPQPMHMISRQLARAMTRASLQTVYGAGHMAPMSQAAVVNAMMVNHIVSAELHSPRGEVAIRPDMRRAA
jgi:pimeloyl-ACP methyl ester carboxylesterase